MKMTELTREQARAMVATGRPTMDLIREAFAIGAATPAGLIEAGARMANCMYNHAQRCGHSLTSDDCTNFDNLRKEWDAARLAMKLVDTPVVQQGTPTVARKFFDKNGREIQEFAVLKIFHFTGARRKRHYTYKWVRNVGGHLVGTHLISNDQNEWFGLIAIADKETGVIADAEIVQQYDKD